MKKFFAAALAGLGLAVTASAVSAQATGTLAQVKSRGILNCGSNTGLAGFGLPDAQGNWVGTGTTPPPTAAFVRRWSIQPLPTNPNNTLVLQVLVSPLSNEQARQASEFSRTRMAGDALLISVKTRKAS